MIVGTIAAHPFDDASYAQHAQFFYFLSVNPAYGLPMGMYYDVINIGGYFVTIVSSIAGVTNVLTIQLGVKIPLIMFTFLTAYFLYKLLEEMGHNGHIAALLLLTSPIYFFTSVIYGSAIVVSMFFLVASVYFLFKKNTLISAALYGMSVGSYLYPVFSIPFLLRYVNKEKGKRDALLFLAVAAATAAIGQLSVLYIYYRTGYYAASPNNPSGYVFSLPPHVSASYYSIFDILNVFGLSNRILGGIYSYSYYGSALAASFSYFLLRKEKVGRESLVSFLLIQGVLFSALNPYNLPSYMAAVIPFAIIIAVVYRRWMIIGLLWFVYALSFGIMQTINSVGFLIYFSDVNLKILAIRNLYPIVLNDDLGFLYSFSLLCFIPIVLRMKRGNVVKFTKSLISQFSTILVLAVVALIVLAPVASSVPSGMFLESSLNTFQVNQVSESLNGTSLVATYSVPLVGLMDNKYTNYLEGYITLPSTQYVVVNDPGTISLQRANFSEILELQFPVTDPTLKLFGSSYGNVTASLSNSSYQVSLPAAMHLGGNGVAYSFQVNATLSGFYTLDVESNVPLYFQNQSSLAVYIAGIPSLGKIVVNGSEMHGNLIPGSFLKSRMTVIYSGPYEKIPPFGIPLVIQLEKSFGKPISLSFAEGGTAFVFLVLLPSLILLVYATRKVFERD